MENTVYFEQGTKNDLAVVLSCPGQEEENSIPAGPAKGETGKNLNCILEMLATKYKQNGFTRKEVLITNSWDKIEYPVKTGRSEATINEILDKDNLDRLSSELTHTSKYLLACGNNAIATTKALDYAKKLDKDLKLIFVNHLGNQALNTGIKQDINGNNIITYKSAAAKPVEEKRSLKDIAHDNKIKRLEVVANEIFRQL
jgi:hypothetical protein